MPSDRHHHRRRHATPSRSRSRSPHNHGDHRRSSHRTRSRSPTSRRTHHHHGRHRHHASDKSKKQTEKKPPQPLPLSAQPLSRHADYRRYKPMFALYLDIQKQLVLEELDEEEVRGRWKSFVGKWNRGELAEGWYDPVTLEKAIASSAEHDVDDNDHTNDGGARAREPSRQKRPSPDYSGHRNASTPPASSSKQPQRGEADESQDEQGDASDTSSDDDFGPAALPAGAITSSASTMTTRKSGPAIPRLEDLEYRDDLLATDATATATRLRAARHADAALHRARLAELAPPRADPGTRERRLEKRADKTSTLHSFREAKEGGAMEDVGESDLMGGGGDGGEGGVEEYRQRRKEMERRKTDREVRREEVLRARAAEREEKFAEHRAKEERTMDMLRGLAKARFGGGGGGEEGGGEW
ncbi:rna helicase hel117 [Diplodia corticola]|uniref:Rna helicase hel117 n=1 Tax=Diplodia corticola TaxID=236234 RepID=A0A1J9RJ06_9PEZI|nr:rna helicase hel117 [Diplodia corticola]OJD40449.1 rna helicase hel117 [Diplodia corticola]